MTDTEHKDPVQVRRAYKFLLRPTSKQADALAACLEDIRHLYNAALEERREAWRMGRHRITFYSQDAQLKEIRAADPERYGQWAFSPERSALRRLDRAFAAFYRRCETGRKPGYPRFKGQGRINSLEWRLDERGCKWDSDPCGAATRVSLKGIGHVRVHQHRAVKGLAKTITVKREGARWFVILACDDVPTKPLPATGAVVGVDLGLIHFLTTSDGTHVPNPRPLATMARRLAKAQQDLARKKRGSRRRSKAVTHVAALHSKVRRQRLDHAHKTALALVRDHDAIVHEALKITNMTRSASGTLEQPGTKVAAKSGLNRSILDAGWGVFLGVLASKAEEAGRMVIAVNPRHTSQQCSKCGHIAAGNRDRHAFRCLACGHQAHADVNAAINIMRSGLDLQAAQAA